MKIDDIVGKQVSLTYHNGFVIKGVVTHIAQAGIFFRTPTKTSFISWQSIRDIIPLGRDDF